MEQPVLTVCNYVDVIGSYVYTYVTGRVCYTAACTHNLDTLYLAYVCVLTFIITLYKVCNIYVTIFWLQK